MKRTYLKWFSPALGKEMEVLIFGHTGTSVLFFPTRGARFFDYENWRVIEALRHKIEAGQLQIYCVDSVDSESFYNFDIHPTDRIKRHLQYERYILNEVIPFIKLNNTGSSIISAGCSMGAYHAVNIAFRHPQLFVKVLGMSGRYDLTHATGSFVDLLSGFQNEDVYYITPSQFVPNLTDQRILNQYRKMEIILVIGEEDAFLNNNKHLHAILLQKGVPNSLFIWHEEAHRARYWRRMVQLYL
jgi:esterase/lipase superfamily enzyme